MFLILIWSCLDYGGPLIFLFKFNLHKIVAKMYTIKVPNIPINALEKLAIYKFRNMHLYLRDVKFNYGISFYH